MLISELYSVMAKNILPLLYLRARLPESPRLIRDASLAGVKGDVQAAFKRAFSPRGTAPFAPGIPRQTGGRDPRGERER